MRIENKVSSRRYFDETGNTYHVEQAHNKRWVVMRYNPSNHRKMFKAIAPCRKREEAQLALDVYAECHTWDEVK